MGRLDIERQNTLQPKRLDYTKGELEKLGFNVKVIGETELQFVFERELIKFFPYSGWHTGKTIKDGRGFKKLIRQLK